MKALIPAAGTGSRLGKGQKALIKILDKPIISYVIENLKEAGIEDIFVTVGYEREEVMKYLKGTDIKIIENKDYSKGSLYSLYHARKHLNENFLFSPCDTIVHPNGIKKIVREAEKITLGVTSKKTSTPLRVKNGYLETGKGNCYSAGVAFMDKIVFKFVREILPGRTSLNDLLEYCMKRIKIKAVDISRFFVCDIDTAEDLHRTEEELNDKKSI